MKIFQQTHLKKARLLNPDATQEAISNQQLYTFFDTIEIPETYEFLVGLYIEITFSEISIFERSDIYRKVQSYFIKKLKKFLDIGYAQMIQIDINSYFIVMFDIEEEMLTQLLIQLKKDIEKRTLHYENKEHHLSMQCGLYFADPYVDAHVFFNEAKRQHQHTIEHHSFLSIYSSLTSQFLFE